jgi:hypothetical protein
MSQIELYTLCPVRSFLKSECFTVPRVGRNTPGGCLPAAGDCICIYTYTQVVVYVYTELHVHGSGDTATDSRTHMSQKRPAIYAKETYCTSTTGLNQSIEWTETVT